MNIGWWFVGLACLGILMIQGTAWLFGAFLIAFGLVCAELTLFREKGDDKND